MMTVDDLLSGTSLVSMFPIEIYTKKETAVFLECTELLQNMFKIHNLPCNSNTFLIFHSIAYIVFYCSTIVRLFCYISHSFEGIKC